MSDEVDTDATSVTQIALSLEEMGDNIYYDAAAILRALAAERDAQRQRKRELLDRLAWVEGERISWRQRAEKAEAEKLHLRDVVCESMSQLRWLNEKEQRGSTNTVLARLEHALHQSD